MEKTLYGEEKNIGHDNYMIKRSIFAPEMIK